MPYWFKRSTSFLGNQRCWSRCQHSMITRFTVADSSAWFDPTSITAWPHAIRNQSPGRCHHRLRRDVLNWLCTFPPAEMQTFAILTVPRGWRITSPSDDPDHWTTFCLRAQHAVILHILRNTPKMAIFGYFAKIVKNGGFETPKMAKTRIGGTNMW